MSNCYQRARKSQLVHCFGKKNINLHGPGQIRIVLTIARYKKGVTQDELAKSLLVDKASISRMILPLINNSIVKRDINPEDRRAYIIKLSDKVKAKIPEIRSRAKRWTEILSTGFTPKDLERLFFYLEILEKNAQCYIRGESDEKEQD
jgi:DNA-binding MarR family transcriptional regulator